MAPRRSLVAALRSALVPFRPQASELVKARRGKAGFTRNQANKTPCPCREAGQKRSGENEHLRNRDREDHQFAGAWGDTVAPTVGRDRIAAQPREQEDLPGRQFIPAV